MSNISLIPQELHICAVDQDSAFLLESDVLVSSQWCESPVLADNDLLSAREFVHRSSKSFNGVCAVAVVSSDRKENLANVYASNSSVWFAPGTSHSSLQSIGTSARQHLVDTDDVIRMSSDAEMEVVLSSSLDEVSRKVRSAWSGEWVFLSLLVGANTSSFKGF